MQEDNTIDSQNEVKKIIEKEINQKIPDTQLPPLAQTALHIQDDLIIMRQDDQDASAGKWRLVAGSLCFPSSWNLKEKFGKPIEAIHQPVPYMEGKMNDRINRIFNALKTNEPLWRQNWSIKNDDVLRHDTLEGKEKMLDCSKPIFIRWEYQTLHKLPSSEDILFTIKIFIQPIKEVIKNDSGQKIIGNLKTYYEEMGEDGRKYKRINDRRIYKMDKQNY